jgi:hypothetical protein
MQEMNAQMQALQAANAKMEAAMHAQHQAHRVQILEMQLTQSQGTIADQRSTIENQRDTIAQLNAQGSRPVMHQTGTAMVMGMAARAAKAAIEQGRASGQSRQAAGTSARPVGFRDQVRQGWQSITAPPDLAGAAAGTPGGGPLAIEAAPPEDTGQAMPAATPHAGTAGGSGATSRISDAYQAGKEVLQASAAVTGQVAKTVAQTAREQVAIQRQRMASPAAAAGPASATPQTPFPTHPSSDPAWGAAERQQLRRGSTREAATWLKNEQHKLDRWIQSTLHSHPESWNEKAPKMVRLGQHAAYLNSLSIDADSVSRRLSGVVSESKAAKYVDAVKAAATEFGSDTPDRSVMRLTHPDKALKKDPNYELNFLSRWNPLANFLAAQGHQRVDPAACKEFVNFVINHAHSGPTVQPPTAAPAAPPPIGSVSEPVRPPPAAPTVTPAAPTTTTTAPSASGSRTSAPAVSTRPNATPTFTEAEQTEARRKLQTGFPSKADTWLNTERQKIDGLILNAVTTDPQQFLDNPSKLLAQAQHAMQMKAMVAAKKSDLRFASKEMAQQYVATVSRAHQVFHTDSPALPKLSDAEHTFLATYEPLRTLFSLTGSDNSAEARAKWMAGTKEPVAQVPSTAAPAMQEEVDDFNTFLDTYASAPVAPTPAAQPPAAPRPAPAPAGSSARAEDLAFPPDPFA